ncbi:hypothetical protein EUGRSUZ_A02278 [Eucalyptus grandis]|uniref:Protein kinase domain-containing protein n=2 Tax=Eucalyptus grandis TaxID=71139 RepID=A0A059DHP5_EUCGR|nr:hypothetical protein EUGRSUZ_A02278 [Eucalyptus grandis]
MVFKFSTFNLTEDPPDFNLPSPPASQSLTTCLPLNHAGCSFFKAITPCQVTAGASLCLANSASTFDCWRPSESVQCPVEGCLKRFTFDELKVATNNFSETKKVGEGLYGCVYEGILRDDSRVAIKRLARRTSQACRFHAEVKLGTMICHRNLARVQGFCLSSEHGEYMLVDIKPEVILLDEDFEAYVADSGTALFMDEDRGKAVSEGEPSGEDAYFNDCPMGTLHYMDPEHFTGKNSVKSDVYGFGLTLLELISGRRAWETTCLDGNKLVLLQWAHALSENEQLERLVDTNMPCGYDKSEVEKTVRLALLCTQLDPKKRPYMAEAVLSLEGIISLEKRWEKYQTDAVMRFENAYLD